LLVSFLSVRHFIPRNAETYKVLFKVTAYEQPAVLIKSSLYIQLVVLQQVSTTDFIILTKRKTKSEKSSEIMEDSVSYYLYQVSIGQYWKVHKLCVD
jgi:hypothetical protein